MKSVHCGLLACIATLATSAAPAADWIGLEPVPTLHAGYSYQYRHNGDDEHRLSLRKDFATGASVSLDWSSASLDDNTTKFDNERFGAALWLPLNDTLAASLDYGFEGESGELEIEQLGLALSYMPLPFAFSLALRDGDVILFTRATINRPRVPAQIDSDLEVLQASFSWLQEGWGIYLDIEDYSYSRNLSALATRPLLQLLVKPGALANSGLLLDSSERLGVSLLRPQRDFNWQYALSSSAVDRSDSRDLSFSWREYHRGFDMIYDAGYTFDEDDPWSIGIGFEWHG